MNKSTPAQIDQAIAELMKSGMTGESYKLILVTLQTARAKAEKKLQPKK